MKKLLYLLGLLLITHFGYGQYGVLSDSELDEFKVLAEIKAEQFGMYIGKIGSKTTSLIDKETAISQACNLFIHDTVIIQISYCGSGGKPTIYSKRLNKYLRRLSLLNYDKIIIEWIECALINDLRKGDDGNYYGMISFVQRFTGIKGEREYSDITTKNMEVVIKPYQKPNEVGDNEWRWEVFLSDVNVKEPCS